MIQSNARNKTIRLAIIVLLGLALVPVGIRAEGATTSCSPAGTTGLTTLIVSHSSQVISGKTIDATGCDVGIYVPPNSHNVIIMKNDISGAKIHGIFVQDSSNININTNKVHDNGAGVPAVSCDFVKNGPCVAEGKAVQLDGTSNSIVSH